MSAVESINSEIPKWSNANFFQDILRKNENDPKITIKSINYSGLNKGDHYASLMFRVFIEYQNQGEEIKIGKYIVKSVPTLDLFQQTISECDMFKKEIKMYDKIIPEMMKILGSINEHDQIFPNVIFTDYQRDILIFEDLSVDQYKNHSRIDRLDLIHAKLVLNKLAKIHAASVVLQERQPSIFSGFDNGLCSRQSKSFIQVFLNNFNACMAEMSQWDDCKKFLPKLKRIENEWNEYVSQIYDPLADNFNVLIHGDLWTNNIMYKYNDKNEPINALLIDLQFPCWTSPAIDLQYFCNTSLKENLRQNNVDELIQYYHSQLVMFLEKLNTKKKIPTLLDIHIQMMKKGFLACLVTLAIQPVIILEITENADTDGLFSDGEKNKKFRQTLYENPNVKNAIKYLLPIFDKKGFLD